MTSKKIIAVVGATGAQGIAVIDALLATSADGSPSPFAVRGLTRNAQSKRALALKDKGVEWVEGSTNDMKSIARLFDGAYGAFVNTDSFTIGEEREIWSGMKIFEAAKRAGSVRHYVWSSLDHVLKDVNFNEKYSAKHYDGKSRVTEYIKTFESDTEDTGLAWSILTTGPYMESLNTMFRPIKVREDGTYVFAIPIDQGHLPLNALHDIGFWARHIFEHRKQTSAQELKIASDIVSLDGLVRTFTDITGKPAVYVNQTVDEWWGMFEPEYYERPLAISHQGSGNGLGKTTFRESFSAWWNIYRDDVIVRDMEWIKSVHPGTMSLAEWMRENGYDGGQSTVKDHLKTVEDGELQFTRPRYEVIAAL